MKAQHIATIALASIVVTIGTAGIATAEYDLIRTRGQAVATLFDRVQLDTTSNREMVASNFDFKTYDDEAMNPELAADLDDEIAQTCPKAPKVVITTEVAKPRVAAQVIKVRGTSPARTAHRLRRVSPPVAVAAPVVRVTPALTTLPSLPPQAIQSFSRVSGFTVTADEKGAKIAFAGMPQSKDGKHVFVFSSDGKDLEAHLTKLGKMSQVRIQGWRDFDDANFAKVQEAMKFRALPKTPAVWRSSTIPIETAKEIEEGLREAQAGLDQARDEAKNAVKSDPN